LCVTHASHLARQTVDFKAVIRTPVEYAMTQPTSARGCPRRFATRRASDIARALTRETSMKVAVPKEILAGERRVALTPDAVAALVKGGLEVLVERGAGAGAFHADDAYQKAGADIAPDAVTLYGKAEIVLKVQKPTLAEVDQCREGTVLVSFLSALSS